MRYKNKYLGTRTRSSLLLWPGQTHRLLFSRNFRKHQRPYSNTTFKHYSPSQTNKS